MAPVAPSGWPSAIAPPFTLTRSGSMSRRRIVLQGDGGERLVDLPEVDVARRHAGLLQRALGGRRRGGQHDHRLGAGGRDGADARARLQRRCASRSRREASSTAAAPSTMPLELPAVCTCSIAFTSG